MLVFQFATSTALVALHNRCMQSRFWPCRQLFSAAVSPATRSCVSQFLTRPRPSASQLCTPLFSFLQRRRAHIQTTLTTPRLHMPEKTPQPAKFANFDLIRRVNLDFSDITVSKWQSRTTGLTVVHLDYEGVCVCVYEDF